MTNRSPVWQTGPQDFNERLAADAALVEDYLTVEFARQSDVPPRLGDAMRYAVLGGGKRFRPFLVMESAGLFGIDRAAALPVAASLECLHCYSLVHDDLPAMDNDRMRRGRPTVWVEFDDWTAVLVGDALLTYAFELISRSELIGDAEVRAALVTALAKAAGPAGMVGGQALDLESDKLGQPPRPDVAHIRHMQSLKTGALLKYACESGGLLGNAAPEQLEALRIFGNHIGFAFQIADDLLDIEGSPKLVGKATGKDTAAGKATIAGLLGVDAARALLAQTEAKAVDALAPFGDCAELLRTAAHFVVSREA